MDITSLLLLLLAALGILSGNATVTIPMLILLLLRIAHVNQAFPGWRNTG